MEKVAMRAVYTTETVYNEGFVCISDNGIEGVFGLDYFRLVPRENCYRLHLSEMAMEYRNKTLYGGIRKKGFISQTLYDTQLYCPETYLFFSESDHDGICLSLTERVTDKALLRDVFSSLEKLRKREY